MPKPRLLLTRPEADSRRFAAMLPEFEAVISPILRIEPVAHDRARLHKAPGLVFTSANAVPMAGPGRGRLALCVGGRTAVAARSAGFDVRQGNGFAEGLLPLIDATEVPLIHPHGRYVARKLPVEGVVVYDQLAEPLNQSARNLLQWRDSVFLPLFSPRSAQLLSHELLGACAPIWAVAISASAIGAMKAPLAGQIIASSPSAEAMVKATRALRDSEQS